MKRRVEGWLHRHRHKAVLRRWRQVADMVPDLGPAALRRLSRDAGSLHAAVGRARSLLAIRTKADRLPLSDLLPRTDRAWRLPALLAPLSPRIWTGSGSPLDAGGAITLFHDATHTGIVLRQGPGDGAAPFAFDLEVFDFDGGFLSIVVDLPPDITQGLVNTHLVGLAVFAGQERPERILLRLNLRHGPNVSHLFADYPAGTFGSKPSGPHWAEFDVIQAGLDGRPVDHAWLDILPENPAMTRLRLSDLVLTRRPRAML